MGSRAVITWSKAEDVASSDDIGIYIHWRGDRPHVDAFLAYCELQEYREPDHDDYGYARLCQVIANYFGGTTSIGIEKCRRLDCDNGNNGTYICKGWRVVSTLYGTEDKAEDITDILLSINASMPFEQQLPVDQIQDFTKRWLSRRKR